MLAPFTTAVAVALVLVNLAGLTLLGHRLTGSYALSKIVSPVAAALVAFFLEHFVGLGSLSWLWPITTAGSVWLLWHDARLVARHWKIEVAFLAAFAWVLLWRVAYPGLVASSEKIGDLAMIASYLPGGRLPPVDAWYPPYPFDVYYAFQHYAAALLGRTFDLSPGLTYNVAFCLVVALTLTAAAVFAHAVCRSVKGTTFVVLALAVGGTGASLPLHFVMQSPQLYSSMRFISGAARIERVDTAFGRALASTGVSPATTSLQLPSETFAYLLSLGDYHSQLSAFYLLLLALACLALIETGRHTRAAQAVLAATPVLCTVTSAWTLPLQTALVLAWVAYRVAQRRPPEWKWLAAGALVSTGLCYPFLADFAYRSADYGVRLRLVAPGEHTPLLLGAIVLYPVVAAALLPIVFGERKAWIVWSSAFWLLLLGVSEVFYVDDVYSGTFNRFNTTLKWWPWIQAGALLAGGAYAMRSGSRALRYSMGVVLVLVSAYAFDLTRHLVTVRAPDAGRLDGAAWITSDNVERALLDYLRAQPRGIVLQRLEAGAFTPAPALVLFAGQTAFLGWPEHEKLWRGQRVDVDQRARAVAAFYAGTLPDSARWLLQHRIDHVLWLKTESALPADAFDRIDAAIRPAYYWHEYYRVGTFRVGVWSRAVSGPPYVDETPVEAVGDQGSALASDSDPERE
jgi:uncharacterized membrane protein